MDEAALSLKRALFRSTAHAGRALPGWFSGEATHVLSASTLRWHWQVSGGVIRQVRYEVRGCPDLIAACELASGALEGQQAASPRLDLRQIATQIAVPTEKLGKLLLIEDAANAVAIQFTAR